MTLYSSSPYLFSYRGRGESSYLTSSVDARDARAARDIWWKEIGSTLTYPFEVEQWSLSHRSGGRPGLVYEGKWVRTRYRVGGFDNHMEQM